MKRLLIGGVLVVALILPGSASALSRGFAGNVDPSGTIDFTYKKTTSGKKVVGLEVSDVPMECNHGSYTASADTTGFTFEVSHRQFGATLGSGQGPFLNVEGTFTHHYHQAHGTVRMYGDNWDVVGGGTADGCDTGKDDWHAQA